MAEAKVTAFNLVVEQPPMLQTGTEEAALIERAKTDGDALATLYRKYLPTISAYVVRRMGDSSEAEDIVANVFLAMVRGLSRYRVGATPLVAWLYRIATNEINRSIRKRRVRRFFGVGETILDASQPIEPHEKLRLALSQLPVRYQAALSLHYLEELAIDEIALIIGIAPGTVKSRLARGRELLRQRLNPDDA